MTAKRYFLPLLLAGALLAGCDDKKPEQPKVDSTPKTGAADMKADAQKAADQAKAAATDAGRSAADAAKSAADATKAATDKASDTAKTATAGAADATRTQAQEWMTKLEDAVKNQKLDEASTYLDKLQAVRASLPVEWQAKLDSIRTTYEAAKAKAAIPGLNK